ncbi:MAG: hypothetical protein V3R64_06730, partial [Sphingomonadales bacterium]
VIADLWNERVNLYPDIAWDSLKKEAPRVKIANILIQADRNGELKSPREDIHSYVLQHIGTDDIYTYTYILLTLTVFDEPEDVQKILNVATTKDFTFFNTSVSILARMCNQKAKEALDFLESEIEDESKINYLLETREKNAAFKEKTDWCQISKFKD